LLLDFINPRLRNIVPYEGYQYNKDGCLCRFFVCNHIER